MPMDGTIGAELTKSRKLSVVLGGGRALPVTGAAGLS